MGGLKQEIYTFSKTIQVLLVTYLQWVKVIQNVLLVAPEKKKKKTNQVIFRLKTQLYLLERGLSSLQHAQFIFKQSLCQKLRAAQLSG